MSSLKYILTLLPESFQDSYIERKDRKRLNEWETNGKPLPPPHIVKKNIISRYQERLNRKMLIETGTYLGDMIYAQRNNFERIYSIELSEALHHRATRRFSKYSHVTILQGDSGSVLKQLLPTIKEPAMFWLDGHYSGGVTAKGEEDSPIRAEILSILGTGIEHTLLIDDARCFTGCDGYLSKDALSALVLEKFPTSKITEESDVIQIELKK